MKAAAALNRCWSAAFQRWTLDVSYLMYPKLNNARMREAGTQDGLTNKSVNMFTYQVLIQTLQLSERSGTVMSKISHENMRTWSILLLRSEPGQASFTPQCANHSRMLSRKAVEYFQAQTAPFFATWAKKSKIHIYWAYFSLSRNSDLFQTICAFFFFCPFMKIPAPPHAIIARKPRMGVRFPSDPPRRPQAPLFFLQTGGWPHVKIFDFSKKFQIVSIAHL